MTTNFLNADFGDDDEDSGEDFNPQIQDGSGDEQDESEDDSPVRGERSAGRPDSPAQGLNGSTKTKSRHVAAEDSEGDDEKVEDGQDDDEGEGEDLGDEGEDEDEDEDDDIQDRRAKRQKRGRRLNQQLEASMDAEKQAQEFKERYGRRTTAALSNAAFVPQNLLMPDVNKDAKIWGIRCREGKEREIVRKLMQKMLERAKTGKSLDICSVFERGEGSMRGYIFVEAFDKRNVDAALTDVSDVYPRSKTNLVPIKEMPDLLRVNKSKELNPGEYVRIKRGLYAGDLAVVEDVVANGLEVTVKLVPRLTYGADEDVPRTVAGEDAKRKRGFGAGASPATRPPARLFSEAEAKKRHSRFLQSNRGLTGKSFTYRNDVYEDGFLIKEFRLQHLQTENVQPKLEETQMFTKTGQDGSETLDLETLKKSLHDNTTAESSYQVGDEVEVFSGEQKGIIGRTERTSGNIVSIKVTEGELRGQLVEVPVRSLHKRFREGDNVMVVGASKYRDQVGTVLLIKDDKVTILTQDSQTEITVFSRDLREASGVGASSERSKFAIRDLVLLTATSFGCVVSASPQSVMVMETTGEVTSRLPSSLSTIELQRKQVSVDRMGQEIRVGDAVKQVGGDEHSGNIIHLYRNFLYAVDQNNMAENAGIWVSRCNAVVSRGGKAGTAGGIDMSKINPALKTGVNGASMLPPQRPGLDKLVRQRIKIRGGMFKGHRGIVKDTNATEARVELEAKSKTVSIPKELIVVLDGKNPDGQGTPYLEWARLRGGVPRMATGSRIPDTASRVPDGGRTPAWGAGSRTPAWGGVGGGAGLDGGRTPGWSRPAGSLTSYGGAGNMTSYGGAGNTTAYGGAGNTTSYGGAGNTTAYGGSRTPAWSSQAKTPYAADSGFGTRTEGDSDFDAFVSRTPAHQASMSRTPAWPGPGAASAPTPGARAYDAPTPAASAPTPGAGFDDSYTPAYTGAPTPGAGFGLGPIDAPTPGGFGEAIGAASRIRGYGKGLAMDAPTPAATAPTPYAMDAPTPAAGGGPKYAEDDDED
ncbi:hypothetical protein DV735_g5777, partial [Chaetothyriales sp. CBS 134920]